MNAIERDQPGGSQLAATAASGAAADAINCVPPAGGSQLAATATGGTAAAADAINYVPPVLPVRHRPSRNSVMTFHDNRAILLYVTIVTANRMHDLACTAVAECILDAWAAATDWLVGRYVIMPDHIHFFCAPVSYPPPDFHRWMKRWKSLATLAIRRLGGSQLAATEMCGTSAGAINCVPPRNPPLWQRDCWDRQLRTGESYSQKWEYVRNNPVRKGLVVNADDWPYQGELNVLEWHERN